MATLKDDLKEAGISLAFDFMLVALVVCWLAAIVLAILKVSLWIVFGLFLLGAVVFFTINYLFKEEEEEDKKEKEERGEEEKAVKEEEE